RRASARTRRAPRPARAWRARRASVRARPGAGSTRSRRAARTHPHERSAGRSRLRRFLLGLGLVDLLVVLLLDLLLELAHFLLGLGHADLLLELQLLDRLLGFEHAL